MTARWPLGQLLSASSGRMMSPGWRCVSMRANGQRERGLQKKFQTAPM
eukprot:CAMPEP_0171086880 /NCGR_PEP_ID=MMETSP0766_2-20121228/19813_1 /TAXON_ID=439317 /ORGANISM="Gambierdiscus australes, Strain CAWD 149" /LENGTH=47 /DNA_ID= /DNA_START= /DNA_END= /DNA_ORIENTATION=